MDRSECRADRDVPLFRSVDHALRFAYSIVEYPVIKVGSILATLRGGSSGSGLRPYYMLSPEDWHAQGAMIRGHIEHHVSSPQREFLIASYSWNAERAAAIAMTAKHVSMQLGGQVELRLVVQLVQRYFDLGRRSRKSERAIARELGINRNQVQVADWKIRGILLRIKVRAEAVLSTHFERQDLI